ncbi:MAG: hypothetical protein ACRC6X_07915 [Culicoidibacterales bacterium]
MAIEELINRGKALRKAVYEVDDTMKEKMPRKREATGLLENQKNERNDNRINKRNRK